jgi:hypothetical protein
MTPEPWGHLPTARDTLLTRVNYGELTPQQAELEASRLGIEPFELHPDPTDFDPIKEATWSLVMALAWIMWRTPAAVREMWNVYREGFRFWVPRSWQVPGGPIHKGYFIETKDSAALMDLTLLAAEIPVDQVGIENEQHATIEHRGRARGTHSYWSAYRWFGRSTGNLAV